MSLITHRLQRRPRSSLSHSLWALPAARVRSARLGVSAPPLPAWYDYLRLT
jgi:hypothetical protein